MRSKAQRQLCSDVSPDALEHENVDQLAALRQSLLRWFDAEQRNLPWRATKNPYAIWLSEVMLQQTRVEAVIPYYERFLDRFPDLRSLAATPLDQVLPYWSGLGYYRRIRFLHAAVCEVAEQYGGEVPSDERFAALPGVGPYTQAAVRSIAFNVPLPLIDGNVERVLSRLLLYRRDVKLASSKQHFHAFLERWLDRERPGDFNQALMELGATVCVPRSPRCVSCPLVHACRAHAAGVQEELPQLSKRKAAVKEAWIVLVPTKGSAVWLEARGDVGQMAGLWEFPTLIGVDRNSLSTALENLSHGPFLPWKQRGIEKALPLGSVTHSILHRRIRAELHQLELPARRATLSATGRWVPLATVEELPIGGFTRKVLRLLRASAPDA